MRAIWKGYLRCNLVAVPVNMYTAIAKKELQFHFLHKEDHNRVKYQMYCPADEKQVTRDDIVRGYQVGKDTYVVLTEQDFKKAKKDPTEVLDIFQFVDNNDIPAIYYSSAHYLAPDGKVGAQSFALFHRAMVEEKKTAVARLVIRNKESLYAVKPFNGVMIAYTLHYAHEIIGAQSIEGGEQLDASKIEEGNLSLAKTLIHNMTGKFNPEEYRDEYTETLMEIIRAKAAGEEIKIQPRARKAEVINFMEALKKSVQETQKGEEEVPRKPMAPAGKAEKPAHRRKKTAQT
ncbi:MAG TPA: Ku protein [Thermodesulfobacteriota bacterium]|nr:Ku protein [Thermodesulfobacteriota bacterium]